MDIDIAVQIIQTAGVIIAPVVTLMVGYFFACRLLKIKSAVSKESTLLKEALFYRNIIDKYATYCKTSGPDGKEMKPEFWKQSREELGLDSPRITEPARIMRRLKELDLLTEKMDSVIERISTSI